MQTSPETSTSLHQNTIGKACCICAKSMNRCWLEIVEPVREDQAKILFSVRRFQPRQGQGFFVAQKQTLLRHFQPPFSRFLDFPKRSVYYLGSMQERSHWVLLPHLSSVLCLILEVELHSSGGMSHCHNLSKL